MQRVQVQLNPTRPIDDSRLDKTRHQISGTQVRLSGLVSARLIRHPSGEAIRVSSKRDRLERGGQAGRLRLGGSRRVELIACGRRL